MPPVLAIHLQATRPSDSQLGSDVTWIHSP